MKKEYNRYAALALEKAGADARACHRSISVQSTSFSACSQEEALAGKILTKNGINYQTFLDTVWEDPPHWEMAETRLHGIQSRGSRDFAKQRRRGTASWRGKNWYGAFAAGFARGTELYASAC